MAKASCSLSDMPTLGERRGKGAVSEVRHVTSMINESRVSLFLEQGALLQREETMMPLI